MTSFVLFLLLLVTAVASQSVKDWGTSGGSGPSGGIGDTKRPVLRARAIITDGYVPTSPNTTRQLADYAPPRLIRSGKACGSVTRRVVVDSTSAGARQEMLGFGHAWTDSTVDVFNQLKPALLDKLMNELFGQNGNNMGFMRHTIGSSDLSGEQYSFDDGAPDIKLARFSLGRAGTRMAQMIARMGDFKGDVFLYSAPWSYPGWMKNNGLFVAPNGPWDLKNSLNPSYIGSATQYLVNYIDAYKKYRVNINGLSLMNEPLNYQGGYPTMFLGASDAASMLRRGLSWQLRQRGVKLMAYDHNTDQPAYPAEVIKGAPGAVDAAAWHCYQSPTADYTVLDDFRNKFPTIPQFMTECANTAMYPGTMNFWIAQNFIPAVRNGASGASFWVLATDREYGPHIPTGGCTTCSGSIFVTSSNSYEKTIDYYMMGQFSRFIRKGGVNYRILQGVQGGGTDWTSQFYAIAVKNPDGGWAVVFLNTFPTDQQIQLDFTGSGSSWVGTVPRESVVTWLLPADSRLNGNFPDVC